ncbi:MAG: RNA polymerase sigma factor [Phycisphaerae bacterium]
MPEIVLAAREGSEQAYQYLVSSLGPGLLGYFYRNTGNRAEAEDLLQEIFLRVVRGLPKYKEQERFEIWVYRMARHLLIDYWRKRKIRYSGDEWMLEQEIVGDALSRAVACETGDELQKAIGKLSPEQREVILMRYFSDLSFDEISKINGSPMGTVLARAHRGLGKLREILGGSRLVGRKEAAVPATAKHKR